jgi:hypothetical protein
MYVHRTCFLDFSSPTSHAAKKTAHNRSTMRGFDAGCVAGAHSAAREADLPGGLSSHYLLCDRNTRLYLPDLTALRVHLARVAFALCGDAEFPWAVKHELCIRPVLVACLKNCFREHAQYRTRLVFDLDADDNATMPPPQVVREKFVAWLVDVFPNVCEWQHAQCVIFGGAFADKPASMHVYFPQYCFEENEDNRFAQHKPLTDRLTAAFSEWNLKLDVSIHTGGLKYPYMDKWIKSSPPKYRGASQQLLLMHNIDFDTWIELFSTCDPLVASNDAAYNNVLNFPRRAQRPRLETVQPSAPVVLVQPIVEIDNIVQRIYDAVPQWNRCVVIRKQARHGQGIEIFAPQSSYCPLKQLGHSTSGASYVVRRSDNSLLFKCQKGGCANKSMELADPNLPAVQRNILERFNSNWVILEGNTVAQLPIHLQDGTYHPLKVMTHQAFTAQTKRNTEKIGKVYHPTIWLQHEHARRCECGLICSPTPVDPRYYNTWVGVRPDVAAMAATFATLDDAALRAMCPNWLSLVERNICNDDVAVRKFVFDWFAHCYQRPGDKPGVALVFTGPPGCGKGLTGAMIVNIYGSPHAVAVTASNLNGNFNSLYSNTCVMLIDEMEKVKNSKFDNSKFKSLVTEPTGVHSEKYVKESTVRMFQHIIMLSNSPDMIAMQNNERRYFIQQCNYTLGEPTDPDYLRFCAAVAAETTSVVAMAAVYTLLMRRDITAFVPMIHPTTKAHWHARYLSMGKAQKFVYRVLSTGNLTRHNLTASKEQKPQFESLVSDYVVQGGTGFDLAEIGMDVFERKNMHYPKELMMLGYLQHFPNHESDEAVLWREGWYKLLPPPDWKLERTQTVDNTVRTQTFMFPPLAELRRKFVQMCGNINSDVWTPEWMIE